MRGSRLFFGFVASVAIAAPSGAEPPKALTNDDVVQMVQAGLPESTVLLSVENAPAAYSTGPGDLIDLKNAGVTQPVLDAMLKKASGSSQTVEAVSAGGSAELEPVGIPLPLDLGSAEKARYQACADEINARRRADGIPEIKLIDGEEAVAAREKKKRRKAGLGLLQAIGESTSVLAYVPGAQAIHMAGQATALGATAVDAADTVKEAGGLDGKNIRRNNMAVDELTNCIAAQNAEAMRAQAMEDATKMMEQAQKRATASQ